MVTIGIRTFGCDAAHALDVGGDVLAVQDPHRDPALLRLRVRTVRLSCAVTSVPSAIGAREARAASSGEARVRSPSPCEDALAVADRHRRR